MFSRSGAAKAFRMGNLTSSRAVGSSAACVQYVQGWHGGAVVRVPLCGVGMLSPCLRGFSPGSLASSHLQKHALQEVVSQNCVVIFSKTTCPYCRMAKNVFNEIGATYKVIELDEHNDGQRLQETLAHLTGAKTVPRVFINGNCIGGGSDTKALHQQGKLLPLIEKCAPCCTAGGAEGSGSGQFQHAK
ncbi:glutaredoxin 2 isoform X2 [Antennarius striatus]|uniref:glutaredoxin 2 isoform X2 n=1 Tax=Antennarius striatus TaxID=241820 RepID=UPI0035B1FBCC